MTGTPPRAPRSAAAGAPSPTREQRRRARQRKAPQAAARGPQTSGGLLVRVQHHPTRAALLGPLTTALAPLDVEVITDDAGQPPSAWRTYRRCLTQPTGADHLLVLQDDAIPADGLAGKLPEIVAAQPDRLILLFVSGAPSGWHKAVRHAHARGDRWAWAVTPRWTPTVATVWPREMADAFVVWADAYLARQGYDANTYLWDDPLLGRWVRTTHAPAVATVPSVVQHPDREPSLVRPMRGKRRADTDPNRVAAVWTGTADYNWGEQINT